MKKSIFTIFVMVLALQGLSYLMASCRKVPDTNGLEPLYQEVPAGFTSPLNHFTDNPLTKEGFELGRRLFYDGRLSADTQHPCSSCHQQIAAFGTFEHDRSHGVNESHTLRNAPVLSNLAWSPSLHWDGEFTNLKDEAAQPINGHLEMGESFEGIIQKLQDDPDYRKRFKEVFKYPFIRPEFILKALAQFTGFMVSANSRYDQFKAGTASFTAQELNGYQLYKDKCSTCHPEPLFTDFSLRNIGLPVDNILLDYGRMRITGKKEDSLKFKVPTLRNVNVSSNYMHDGRFNTLGQVMNHYRNNVQPGPTLDPLLSGGISLTTAQTNEIIAFMKTLTDSSFLKDSRFSNPF